MLTIISGEWGTGKTKYLVERMEKDYRSNVYTVSNFNCAFASLDCSKDPPDVFLWKLGMLVEMKLRGVNIGNIIPLYRLDRISVYIDEGALYFSPEQQERMRKKDEYSYQRFQTLLAQVRKLNINVFVTCQTIGRLGKDIRRVCDDYMHLRWVLPMPYYVYSQSERDHTIREELRYRVRLQWIEHHMVSADDPQYNYRKTLDVSTGRWVYAESSTLVGKPKIRSDYGKDYQYGCYHSYEPIGISVEEYKDFDSSSVDFSFILKDSCYIMKGYRKDNFPTFKRFLRFLGMKIIITDEFLPQKIYFEGLRMPDLIESHDSTTELSMQNRIVVASDEMRKIVLGAYATGKMINMKKILDIGRLVPAKNLHQNASGDTQLSPSDDGRRAAPTSEEGIPSAGFKQKLVGV